MVGAPFAERFAAARADRGPLVWGLDPSAALLERWGLGDDADGLERFVDVVIGPASEAVGVVKPQLAFFERHGWQGLRALSRLALEARSAGLLVVMDAKRGDIGSTNDAYADAFLGPDAPLAGDALTVTAYLGFGAMAGLVQRAYQSGRCLLVVTRSSNPEGRPLQLARGPSGRSVEAQLLADIGACNAALVPGGIGPVGAVVAPTVGQPRLGLRDAGALFLAPGVGAQGATLADVAEAFGDCPERVMPSASRSLLSGGPDPGRLRDDASVMAAEARRLLSP